MFYRSRAVWGRVWVIAAMLVIAASVGVSAQECSVTIDSVAGARYDGGLPKLIAGTVTTFKFRCNVTCDSVSHPYGFNITNAFVISSPDGGDWGYAQARTYPDWGLPDATTGFRFGVQFLNHFNKTGGSGDWGMPQGICAGNIGGNDSVAVLFAGSSMKSSSWGMPGGYNGVPYGIEIRPTVDSKHICIDTAKAVPGGPWKWPSISITYPSIIPNWYSGPQCFEVVSCCSGESTGNIDMSSDGLVTMGDLTVLINYLFIGLTPLRCPAAANLDQSPDELITMGDLTVLIDHLYITLTLLPACP